MDKNRFIIIVNLMLIFLSACTPKPEISSTLPPPSTAVGIPQAQAARLVPDFAHIIIIPFENHEFDQVIRNAQMPNYNLLASHYTLLTQYYAIRHPSLPNYIALVAGDTFGIDRNCSDCFINEPSLPDLIEQSG